MENRDRLRRLYNYGERSGHILRAVSFQKVGFLQLLVLCSSGDVQVNDYLSIKWNQQTELKFQPRLLRSFEKLMNLYILPPALGETVE